MKQGYIKLFRAIQDNHFWLVDPFSRGQAWVDMLMLANHKDGFIYVRGNKVAVKRGQLGWSVKRLSERWKWSRGKVQRFLNDLENEQQIEQQKNTISSLITIKNYEKYQEQRTADRTTDGQQTDTNKNGKNITYPTGKSETLNLWDVGKGMGLNPAVIGKQIKSAGEEKVAQVIADMAVKRPAEPTQYFIAATTKKKRGAVC